MSERSGTTQPDDPAARPGFRPVSVAELRETRRLQVGLLALAERTTDADLENLGIKPEEVAEMRRSLEATDRAIPSARNLVLGTFTGALDATLVLSAYAKAQRAIHALAPLVVLRVAEKIDNDQAPGNTRLLLELLKGLGLLAPAEPVAPSKRVTLLDLDHERKKPVADLKREVLGLSGGAEEV